MMNGNNKPLTILLVDDDPDCRMLIRDAISECRVNNAVLEAANGQEALDILSKATELPGLIYMDIEMPQMNGIETVQRIKSDPRFHHIPVVMMTGVSEEAQMRNAAEAGANSYTLKPANAEQFLKTVLASTNYWLAIHQYPEHRLPQSACRR
ncbi:MAG TPA: response regulator [Tepidisphaeraceae bacterium]|jgi:two-component system response regulator